MRVIKFCTNSPYGLLPTRRSPIDVCRRTFAYFDFCRSPFCRSDLCRSRHLPIGTFAYQSFKNFSQTFAFLDFCLSDFCRSGLLPIRLLPIQTFADPQENTVNTYYKDNKVLPTGPMRPLRKFFTYTSLLTINL